jgi:vanillate/4-hydroxybenzoate decarboxylase subunit D
MNCPRCDKAQARLAHSGRENNVVIWRAWHCTVCSFVWRDSEPAESIDPHARPAWAQLANVDLDGLRQVIPPSRKPG